MMDVSIIFVNYKTRNLTINAINSVMAKTEGISYEIFVVDNASEDGSIEAIEAEFPNINIIKSEINGGFGYANNLAIKRAKGKYILCLNTDTLLINNAIKIMYDFMEISENKTVGACGAYIIDKDGKPSCCGGNFPSLVDVLFKTGFRNLFPEYYKNYCLCLKSEDKKYLENIDYIIGADIFIRKSVLDKVGLFDENIFLFYEETDLCKRIHNAGYSIKFVENAKIKHLEGQSDNNLLSRKINSKKSEFYYFKKHHKNQVWLIKLIYIFIYLLDWLILRNQDSKALIISTLRG